ncbi:HNH endonuclease [Lentisalinibacter sediminis]|uniref:HNH endonuclease n=1 Tax=Lentisalinibacter sediminis TaxID=2992237 RepID=UPI0038691288
MSAAEEQIGFLTTLQRLLEEGSFVSTYKYALLMALADLSVESTEEGDGALTVPLDAIARKFIEYYWPQTAPFGSGLGHEPGAGDSATLLQNTGRQAEVIRKVAEARGTYGRMTQAQRDARAWRSLVRQVRSTIVKMPLWKLQIVGREPVEFLYRHEEIAGDAITLLPGVAAHFRRFHSLVRSLIESAWMRQIRRIRANDKLLGPGTDLAAFLFGTERMSITRYQPILRELQAGRCFYCAGRIRSNAAVDHFIPWSRYPLDLGHNFVLSHAGCNSRKSDYLAANHHLERWAARNEGQERYLKAAFESEGLPHDAVASRHIAKWAYEQAEMAGALVWVKGEEMAYLRPGWRRLFSSS